MKKFKKIFAVLLTLAMVLGMSMTTFAAVESIEIPVKGAGDKAVYQNLQLIEPAPDEATGWKFSNVEIAENYKNALKVSDDQTAIWMLIALIDPDNTNIPDEIVAATEDQVKAAITAVANSGYPLNNGHTADKAGVYYIKVSEPGYAYNPMAAYVSFGYTDGVPSKLETEGVEAKRSEIITGKTSEEENKVTEIGRVETYYVSSTVPFIPIRDENREYWVTDKITGAKYVVNNSNEVTLKVYFGKSVEQVKGDSTLEPDMSVQASVSSTENGQSFNANLTSVLDENLHANESIVITYQATVTDVQVGNDVQIGKGANDSTFGSDSEKLFTGKIIINKKDEKDKTLLSGAGFIISKTVTNADKTETIKYATFDDNNKFRGWADEKENATEVFTDANGTLTVSGLDEGTYHITETTAPNGYSIRDGIEDVTLGVDGNATVELEAEIEVLDTKLGALPSTGGIGTTIFTIGGCVIMIIAAGLFFASRRKSAK